MGISDKATLVEKQRSENLLVNYGKLVCILCNQTIAGNRKSVYKHMLTKKHMLQVEDVAAGKRSYPTTEVAMKMEITLPMPAPTPTMR